MAIQMNRRSHDVGAGIYGIDVAHWGIARRGGVVAHPPCCNLKNLTSGDLNIAIQRGNTILKGTLADGLDEFQNLAPEFRKILADEQISTGMCFKEFNLGTAVTVSVAEAAITYVATATLTTGMPSGTATYYFFVEILSDLSCTLTWTDENSTFSIVQNPSIIETGGIVVGKNTFIMKAVATGATTGSTLVLTPNSDPAVSTGIVTADVKVWLISDWTIDQLSAEF